jgi:RNA polymerase sigma-54 factor
MTPQLQQAIRLLQLPIMELQTQIQEALDQNVMLEVEERQTLEDAEPAPSQEQASAEVSEVEVELGEGEWSDAPKAGPSETPKSAEPRGEFEYADRSQETLKGHLLWQLELENLDPRVRAVGEAIIDAINEDGYLTDDLETIRSTLAPDITVSQQDIESVLRLVQGLDPVGVGARSVSECVLLQLQQLQPDTPGLDLARAIAKDHLEQVADNQLGLLKRSLTASDEELDCALALVRSCNPRPGAVIYAPAADYIVPDVFVRKSDGHWIVELNNSIAPQLRVNSTYAGLLGRGEEYDALRAQLQEARWLIRSLEIRNETLLKVAMTIVQRQTEFLERGEEKMRPMVLRDVAEAIEMHESTVSRVTTNKYMHTPRGIFEFRYFFSSHLASEKGEQSSTAVRAKIRKFVSAEDPGRPLSDNQIARLLSEEGIKVARRTVAKYREGMKIPSSSDRKRSKLAG